MARAGRWTRIITITTSSPTPSSTTKARCGRWMPARLYRHAPEAAALATAALRWELRDLGLGWWRRDNGVWEIAGCDEAVIAEFSQRRHDIAEIRHAVAARLGRPVTGGEDHTIWAETRSDQGRRRRRRPVVGLAPTCRRAGFDLDACFDRADRAIAYERLPERHVETLLNDLADPERGVCAARSDFCHADVVHAVADWSIDDGGRRRKVVLPPDEIVRLADRFCGDERVVVIDPACRGSSDPAPRRRGRSTTANTSCATSPPNSSKSRPPHCRAGHEAARGGAGVVHEHALERALADNPQLNDEQVALVTRWCTSGDRVQAAVGRAGTGKTTTMRVAAARGATPATG